MPDYIHDEMKRKRPPRVHISTHVESGEAMEQKEIPFVVGVFGDYSNRPVVDADGEPVRVKKRKMVEISRDNFDQVVDSLRPEVAIDVPSALGNKQAGEAPDQNERIKATLTFRSRQDFEPDRVAEQIPALKRLLEERRRLMDLKRGLDRSDALHNKLKSVVRDQASLDALVAELEAQKAAGEKKD